jgi:hypothetical protein
MGANSQGNAIVASTSAVGGDTAIDTGAMATMISHDPATTGDTLVAGVIVPDTSSAFATNVTTAGFAITQQAGWGNVYVAVTNGTTPVHYKFSNVGIKFTDNTVQSTAAVNFTGGTMTSNIAMANNWLSNVAAVKYADGTTDATASLPLTGGTVSGNIVLANRWLSNVAAVKYNDGTTDATASLPLTGGSVTGNVEFNNNYMTNAVLGTTIEKTANIGVVLGAVTVNANTGPIQTAVVSGNITINTNNLTNFNTGESVTLVLTQATNANTRTLTSNLKYAGATKTLSTANAAIDTITITYDGTNYLAALVKGYA